MVIELKIEGFGERLVYYPMPRIGFSTEISLQGFFFAKDANVKIV